MHFHKDNIPVHNSILVTDYLTTMGINTVPQPPYSPDLAPCDFCLFPKLRGCGYETIEEMKEAVTKVIDMRTQEDFHGAFQKLLKWYKCIAGGGDYFEEDKSFMCVLSIKVPIRKKSGNLFNDPRIYIYIYMYVPDSLKNWVNIVYGFSNWKINSEESFHVSKDSQYDLLYWLLCPELCFYWRVSVFPLYWLFFYACLSWQTHI